MKAAQKKALLPRPEPEIDPRFGPVAQAFAKNREVSACQLMSSYGLKVKGKIFAMFGRNQLVVKLPKARVDQLVEQSFGERFDPGHGRRMKEWIAIADAPGTWLGLAQEAYKFVKQATP